MADPFIIVAIDGGAASGKSSSSRTLSERFNLLHVDTGSFYRAVTAEFLRRGVAATDLPAVKAAIAGFEFGTRLHGRSAQMEIGGRVVADAGSGRTDGGSDCREARRGMSEAFPQVAMTPVYGVCHYVVRVCFDMFFRGEVAGTENFPSSGAFLIAASHASHLDPFLIGTHV